MFSDCGPVLFLHGLAVRPELNLQLARYVSECESPERCRVQLLQGSSQQLDVKLENLALVTEALCKGKGYVQGTYPLYVCQLREVRGFPGSYSMLVIWLCDAPDSCEVSFTCKGLKYAFLGSDAFEYLRPLNYIAGDTFETAGIKTKQEAVLTEEDVSDLLLLSSGKSGVRELTLFYRPDFPETSQEDRTELDVVYFEDSINADIRAVLVETKHVHLGFFAIAAGDHGLALVVHVEHHRRGLFVGVPEQLLEHESDVTHQIDRIVPDDHDPRSVVS